MNCRIVEFDSPELLEIYALRQKELRFPLNLNLFNEDLLSEQNEIFFAGFENGKLLTCLQMKKVSPTILKLRQMATDQEYKGFGKGKLLVQFAENWAKEHGYKLIELHARKVAQGFYEKLAYQKVGEEFLEVEIPHYKMEKVLDI